MAPQPASLFLASLWQLLSLAASLNHKNREREDVFLKVANDTNGGPQLADSEAFGDSLALLGDVNGDGFPDLAVGDGNGFRGATRHVHVLFLNGQGTVLA